MQSQESSIGAPAPENGAFAPEKHPKPFLSPMVVDMIAGFSSLFVGGLTFWQITDEKAHKNLSSLRLTEDIKEQRRVEGEKLRDLVKSGTNLPHENRKLYRNAVFDFEAQMDNRFANAGIVKIWDKWSILRSHQKWAVAVTTAAVGGISLGSIFLLTRQMFPSSKEEEPFVKKVEKEAEKTAEIPAGMAM